jgi:hypothetical protein
VRGAGKAGKEVRSKKLEVKSEKQNSYKAGRLAGWTAGKLDGHLKFIIKLKIC